MHRLRNQENAFNRIFRENKVRNLKTIAGRLWRWRYTYYEEYSSYCFPGKNSGSSLERRRVEDGGWGEDIRHLHRDVDRDRFMILVSFIRGKEYFTYEQVSGMSD